MQFISVRNSVFMMLFLITGAVFSQDIGSETVTVVRPYTPSVNDAFKIRETPSITDSISLQKKQVQYSIFSVPVASTFAPAKGRATNIQRERPPKVYDNYATLAFGSYTTALAEFYSNLEVNRTDNFGIFLTHNSSQGGIEEVNFEDKYYDTELNLNYTSRNRNMIWKTEAGVDHRLFNWYGIRPGALPATEDVALDLQQNYFSAYVGGEIRMDDSFFDRASTRYRFMGDSYGSVEHRFTLRPVLELPIAGERFHTNLILDYVGGGFEREFLSNNPIDYGHLNVGLSSSLLVLRDDLTLNLGASVFYSQDIENSDGGVYVYPNVTASYRMAGEYFVGYAGLEGELRQNSYYEFAQENPFVSPTLQIRPTDQQYDLYVGAKGKLTNTLAYNIRTSYKVEDYKPMFISNPAGTTGNVENYMFGNSFSVVYDQVNTLSAFGELNFDVNNNFNLRLNGEYFVYNTDEQGEAWNLPNFKASLLGDYQIGEHWFAGANIFVVGERVDYRRSLDFINPATEVVTLDPFLDLNLNLGYRFNEQLSAFVRGHNLLGNNYERWMDFPVLGLQVMGGVTYKFDF